MKKIKSPGIDKRYNQNIQEDQLAYARIIEKASYAGIFFIIVAFVIYGFQVYPSNLPPEKSIQYLMLRASDYAQLTDAPKGWAWVYHLDKSDVLSFSSIVFVGMISFIAYFRVLSLYVRKRNKTFAILAFFQLLIFMISAFGFFTFH